MDVAATKECQARINLTIKEIKIIGLVYVEVKNVLNYEPEFETRVGAYYTEVESLISSLGQSNVFSLNEIRVINNILNEVCNGISIDNFHLKLGISKIEVESYLDAINKVVNQLHNQKCS